MKKQDEQEKFKTQFKIRATKKKKQLNPNKNALAVVNSFYENIDCDVIGISKGNLNLLDMIQEIFKRNKVASLTLCVWSVNIVDLVGIRKLVKNHGCKIKIVLDPSIRKRKPKAFEYLLNAFKLDDIRSQSNHTRFILIELENNKKISIITSMDLTLNINVSSYTLSWSPDLYDLYSDYVIDLFKHTRFTSSFKAIDKKSKVIHRKKRLFK